MTDYDISIPSLNPEGTPVNLTLSSGQHAFLLGANGSGKSALMHHLYKAHQEHCVRLSAHRQTWFTSDSLELSPQRKRQSELDIKRQDTRPEARWKDDMAAARANIAVYDLIDAENVRARRIAAAVDDQDMNLARELSVEDAPIAMINDLMKLAGLPVKVAIHENERILARRYDSEPYSIAELSDGERNALLIAAAVLTATERTLILIDEPERHLHRSIISPLLTHLFARRTDCAFIVSTHEVLLPIDHPEATTLLVRECVYKAKVPSGWSVDVLEPNAKIPEETKRDILGARRKILFIEGTEESLDKPLYGILFPDVTIVPKGNCVEVEKATHGIRAAEDLHWTEAYGLVDRDSRGLEDVAQLQDQGICAISHYSVESLYYHPEMMKIIAERLAGVDGSNPDKRVKNASAVVLDAAGAHRDRLCARVINRKIREYVIQKMPYVHGLHEQSDQTLTVPIHSLCNGERSKFDAVVEDRDLLTLVQRYPLRETPALARAASELGFKSRRDYEAAVLQACSDDPIVREQVIGWLGTLPSVLNQKPAEDVEQDAPVDSAP